MSNPFKRTLVTAALPYANGPVHIGHLAGCYLPADIFVRYLRSNGAEVKFICGSDEHGSGITIKAADEHITPQQVVDKYHKMMGDAFRDFGISFDIYSRTTSKVHHQTASDFFLDLYKKGSFIEQVTEQYYDEEAKKFLADRYILGTCPHCGNPNAYGDQCEKCGSSLSPTDLIDPRSKLSGRKPVRKKTKNWFLPLDKFQPKIREYLEKHKDWKQNVYNQCMSWLESGDGLQPRSMTRDLDWGIPVPVEGAEGKVLYVWFDAPIGYISATKELLPQEWEKYWKDKETRLIHFIGKDNIVFHCIIFPSMLMEHGDYILPDNVPANEFLNLEGEKISTSKNWAVWLHEYLNDFSNKQDYLRYSLCANAPENKDNDFTWKDFQMKSNSELADIFGNFANRVVSLTNRNYGGIIPEASEYTKSDLHLLEEVSKAPLKIAESLEKFRFREALAEMMNLARAGNKYLAEHEPWKLIKTDEKRVKTIINISLQIMANLGIVCEPFLPFTSKRIFALLNISPLRWAAARNVNNLHSGHKISSESGILFSKIEDKEIDLQLEKLKKNRPAAPDTKSDEGLKKISDVFPAKAESSFDDFGKIDIRVATILEAEVVPKTDKLLKLKLDTGLDIRTVVSGIAKYYQPEKIVGQKVLLLANLAPRNIKGIMSQGMILMAENADGELSFVSPTKENVQNGAIVK